ncbi:SDR family NAD(P)-dependent oxidoreductase [Rhizobium sp. BK376]|uniref:SDR family NAD(P)-dependent oxidoreductase n=1 Tax=Rhizobium sp. BK376 TaxID=2512149 RepID=UPI0010E22C11|nr:SDR family NAD(P)-dependent oxidoreductase [Rhizobium sp. BK376]TCR85917.1 NAD(P)-dependent dehydrogenase (short-subunit alcohol dehydrogenase family) [Rhizobium sp. BK376]
MEQQVVMITGAGGNLGTAIVEHLSSEGGVNLICLERNTETLANVVARVPSSVEVLGLDRIDLTDVVSCQGAVEKAVARFGRIDALVNTVGGFSMGPVDPSGMDRWNHMMSMNAFTAYAISAAVLTVMQPRKYGRIVHVAASPGLKAGRHQAAYAASKAAVIRLTEAIAAENRSNRITANCILPGTIDTPQNRQSMPNADVNDWVPPTSIAKLIAFLISKDSSAVTGSAIAAGGF